MKKTIFSFLLKFSLVASPILGSTTYSTESLASVVKNRYLRTATRGMRPKADSDDFMASLEAAKPEHQAVTSDLNTFLVYDQHRKNQELRLLEVGSGEPKEISFGFKEFEFSGPGTTFKFLDQFDGVPGKYIHISNSGGDQTQAVYKIVNREGKPVRMLKYYKRTSQKNPASNLTVEVKSREIVIFPDGGPNSYSITKPTGSGEILDVKVSGSGTHLEMLLADGREYVFRRDDLTKPFPQSPWMKTEKKYSLGNYKGEVKSIRPVSTYIHRDSNIDIQGTH